jgi:hypothetical protein
LSGRTYTCARACFILRSSCIDFRLFIIFFFYNSPLDAHRTHDAGNGYPSARGCRSKRYNNNSNNDGRSVIVHMPIDDLQTPSTKKRDFFARITSVRGSGWGRPYSTKTYLLFIASSAQLVRINIVVNYHPPQCGSFRTVMTCADEALVFGGARVVSALLFRYFRSLISRNTRRRVPSKDWRGREVPTPRAH